LARRALGETGSAPFPSFLRRRLRRFQGDQQIELFVGFVVPELGPADVCPVLDERHMPVVALVGKDNPPVEGKDAHLLPSLKAVIIAVVVGQRRRDVLGWLIQPLVPFLRVSRLAMGEILRELCPESLVGRCDLARDITGPLRGEMEQDTNITIGPLLQALNLAVMICCIRSSIQHRHHQACLFSLLD
jgi:hypothetical protein